MTKHPANPAEELDAFRAEVVQVDHQVEAALEESRAIDRREAHLNELVDATLSAHRRFLEWHDRMHDYWSHSASRYDARAAASITLTEALWSKVFKVAVGVLNRDHEAFGIEPANAERLRERYREMLSLDLMDNGPMPEHIAELTRQAVEDFRAGRATEF